MPPEEGVFSLCLRTPRDKIGGKQPEKKRNGKGRESTKNRTK
jgi:hypothetical protein